MPAWLRFANSLRMRLAVRLASVAPEKARAEFRKAAADPYRGDRGQYEQCGGQDFGI